MIYYPSSYFKVGDEVMINNNKAATKPMFGWAIDDKMQNVFGKGVRKITKIKYYREKSDRKIAVIEISGLGAKWSWTTDHIIPVKNLSDEDLFWIKVKGE